MDSSSTFNSTLNSWAFSEAEDDEDQDVSAFLQRMAMEIPDSTLKTSPICIPDSNHKKSFRFGEDVESTYQSNQVNHEMMNERSKDSIYTASPESPTTPVSVLSPLMETFPNPHQNNTNSNNVSYYNQISFATRCFVNFEDVWFRDHGGGIGTTSLDESELSPTELDQWHKIMSNLRICGISCKKLMAPGDMGEAAGMNRGWANISPYMYQHEKPESSTSNTQILAITGKSLDPSQFSSSSRATDRRDPDYSDFQGWKSSLIWSDTAKTLFASAITGGEKESMLLLTVSKSSGKVTAENMNGGSSSNGIIWRRERGITKLYITRDIQKVIGRIRPEDQAELTNLSKQSPNLVIIALVNVTATKTTNETTTTQPLTLYDILTFFIGFDFVVLEYDDDDPMDETGQTKSIQRDLRISMKSDVETTSSDQILWQDGQIEEFFAFHGTMDPDTDADNRKIDEMYEKMWPDALDQAQELMERLNKSSTWLNGEDETFSDTSLTENSLTSTPRNAGNFVSASSNPHHHHTHASPGARTTNHYHTVTTIHANSNANANNISKPNTLIAIGESINASSHSNTMMRNTSHRRTMSAKLEPLKRIQSVSASQNQPSKVTTDLFVDSSIHYHQNNQLIHQAIQPQSSLNHQNGSVGVGNGVMTSSHFTVSASSSNNGGSQFSNTLNESGRLLGSGRKVLRPLKSAYSQRTNERANTTIGSSTAQTTIVPRSRPFTAAMRLPPLVSSNSSGIPRNVGSAKVIRSSISSISENPLQQTTFTGTGNNNNSENEAEKTPLKPCCACPDTKAARDKCVLLNGEEACADIIEMHKQCLRDHGFHIL